ncbi:hypothetical protein P8917_10070 [Bacillus atrophaeus]|uniref:hypothetical protein n=1 Tax=Bacillus atrophaeus TaxID=1452 RepID=UPI0022810744|nr:hypothetical protein [Bacillus atrophaeus]MCY8497745.1 hypothetical protein [Bacillus atrophaeus]MCY8814906.1 hypothetical protein [Bacillus atrophaeus]MCY8821548.1 hypothetical protein [Bacillus atrophaeus]MCY8830978.1 hypothetical protein [Bacillus atrophaeus]MCY8835237.1 hypothetical protein [Bacillus atrophaeus]
MFPYRPGDVVRVHNYPFISKAEQEQTKNENNTVQNLTEGKPRYGVVINSGGRHIETIPILQIMSHGGQTQRKDYPLRDDEVRLPENTSYQKKSGKVELYGVIKAERIETFESDEITPPLTTIPLRTKIDLITRYEAILKVDYFKKKLDVESPNHSQVMSDFKTSVLAEKLDFLVTDKGERKFDKMQNSTLILKEIQPLEKIGKNGGIGIYALRLKGKEDEFTYTLGTLKNEKQITNDWSKPMKAKKWISEDIKFQILKKDIDKQLRPNPLIESDKFVSFKEFSQEIEKDMKLAQKKNDLEL